MKKRILPLILAGVLALGSVLFMMVSADETSTSTTPTVYTKIDFNDDEVGAAATAYGVLTLSNHNPTIVAREGSDNALRLDQASGSAERVQATIYPFRAIDGANNLSQYGKDLVITYEMFISGNNGGNFAMLQTRGSSGWGGMIPMTPGDGKGSVTDANSKVTEVPYGVWNQFAIIMHAAAPGQTSATADLYINGVCAYAGFNVGNLDPNRTHIAEFYNGAGADKDVYVMIDNITVYSGNEICVEKAHHYIDGENFASFIDLTDTSVVKIDSATDWTVAEKTGALGGKALSSLTKANPNNVTASGITVTFSVPADGEYTVWARALYPTQAANSLFYSVDGGKENIWDFPDEDDAATACYNSWQYFYMTERAAGTYSDTTLYGAWTIANSQWRHKPATLQLSAGEHTIKITAREGGMFLDELVVTSYAINDYDPNAFTIENESNTSVLGECKFCGSTVKHYVKDIYALKGVTAESYFTSVVCPNATAWLVPVEVETQPEDTTPEDTTPEDTTPEQETTEKPEQGTAAKPEDETNADTEAAGTEAPASNEKKGCSGSVLSFGALALIVIPATAVCVLRKKEQ